MERFSTVFRAYDNIYAEKSPVIICGRALIKDNATGNLFAQLKIRNISSEEISAVKVSLKTFDISGAETESVVEYQYNGLAVRSREEFGEKNIIPLSDNRTASFEVKCREVVFKSGRTENFGNNTIWMTILPQKTLEEEFGKELADQYRRETSSGARFVPDYTNDIWRCTCGNINKSSDRFCNICGSEWMKIYKANNRDLLYANFSALRREEAAKAEQARIQAELAAKAEKERKAKKSKKTAVVLVILLIVFALLGVGGFFAFTKIIKPEIEYKSAISLMESGHYEQAITEFKGMTGYKESTDLITECEYKMAADLLAEGKYEEAISAFKALGDYSDSKYKISECKYYMAVGLMESGEYEKAINIFNEVIDVNDSRELITECENNIKQDKYDNAKSLFAAGKYEEAIAAFEEIIDYSDSAEQIKTIEKEQIYQEAEQLYKDGKYKKALEKFKEIEGYKDTKKKIEECNKKINSSGSSSGSGSGSGSSKNNNKKTGFELVMAGSGYEDGYYVKYYKVTCNKCGDWYYLRVIGYSGTTYPLSCACGNSGTVKLN